MGLGLLTDAAQAEEPAAPMATRAARKVSGHARGLGLGSGPLHRKRSAEQTARRCSRGGSSGVMEAGNCCGAETESRWLALALPGWVLDATA